MTAIGLWLLDLAMPPGRLDALTALLDDEEHARAARFRHARDRDRFIARRGQLRLLLAAEGAGDAGAIRYTRNAHGKPALADRPDLRFNLSYSGDVALCAVARGVEVGCDIAWRDPALADPRVARRLFAAAEWRALEALPPDRRTEGFFNCWTRKEAFIKALGLGVSHPLGSFAVTLAPGDPARIISGGDGWSIASFAPAPGYQAALAAAGDAAAAAAPPRWFDADARAGFSAGEAPAAPGAS
ncbi:MAG TPA: 4'-phosphopantetheinyl transferase superfamily protein [Sphingomonas sp.]